jgi:predicted component of type VI protein secretion system
MTLLLRALSLDDDPLSKPLVGRFDHRGGDIGRSDNATFTLPDPQRLISRAHARISHAGGAYWIENVSSAGPILHNGRPLSSGMRVSLSEGDELRIGGYRLEVAFEHDETSATILRGRTVPTRPLPEVAPTRATPAPAPAPQPAPAPPVALAAPPPADAPAGDDPLWRGFQEGVGVGLPLPGDLSPELMRAIGVMLRIAAHGIHRLVSMRSVAKSEMHADLTMIQVRGNNPLKFAPEAQAALKMLLQPPVRGFLSGPSALRDAVIDLQSHQVGVVAGMRAALAAVLERFDPAQLEGHLTKRSVIESLIPAQRRAHLWEAYLEHYRALKDEAEEDFGRFFGEAFLEAYEAQVKALEAAGDEAAASYEAYPAARKGD